MFLPSFFLDLPLPRKGGNFRAVCDVPFLHETLIVDRSFDQVLSWCRGGNEVKTLIPRTDREGQLLLPWSPKEEADFLGETEKPPASATSSTARPPPAAPEEDKTLPRHPRHGKDEK